MDCLGSEMLKLKFLIQLVNPEKFGVHLLKFLVQFLSINGRLLDVGPQLQQN